MGSKEYIDNSIMDNSNDDMNLKITQHLIRLQCNAQKLLLQCFKQGEFV